MRTIAQSRLMLGAIMAAAALAMPEIASTAAAKTVTGKVGPGFTITLSVSGKKVTRLKAGVPYHFLVSDRSSSHDFHLKGPGLDHVLTSVGFVGMKSFTLRLKQGSYRFFCDPHASFMHGGFKVS
jgi:plastocyanin